MALEGVRERSLGTVSNGNSDLSNWPPGLFEQAQGSMHPQFSNILDRRATGESSKRRVESADTEVAQSRKFLDRDIPIQVDVDILQSRRKAPGGTERFLCVAPTGGEEFCEKIGQPVGDLLVSRIAGCLGAHEPNVVIQAWV